MEESAKPDSGRSWRLFGWCALVAAMLSWLYLIAEALVPFLLAVIFAYIGAPMVDRLCAAKLSRTAAACVTLIVIIFAWLLLPLLLLPVMASQLFDALLGLPTLFAKGWAFVVDHVPGLEENASDKFVSFIKDADLGAGTKFAAGLLDFAASSVGALFGLVAVLLITPFVTFYLLRDWNRILDAAKAQIPSQLRPAILDIASISDQVLGEFLRGQGSVMLLMSLIYSMLLLGVGAPYPLALGLLGGVLTFIPFAGFLLTLALAVLICLVDFVSWQQLALTVGALLVGTSIESFIVTPRLVGERIGLGPAAVLFVLAAMSATFGFAGALLALPVGSLALALWRHHFPAQATSPAIGMESEMRQNE